MVIKNAKRIARCLFPKSFARRDNIGHAHLRRQVETILNNSSEPNLSGYKARFDELQRTYSGVPEYGYDPKSTWIRGADRVKFLLTLGDIGTPGNSVLEVACGDGMAGKLLNEFGHAVQLVDLEDWRDPRARTLPFFKCDISKGLGVEPASFDLIYSYNSFEHFPDPENALHEIIRACKPGGLIYLEFGPLYSSPWGLHAYRMLRMPYPQYIFPMDFIHQKLAMFGVRDLGKDLEELQSLNEWRVAQFKATWHSSGCEVVSEHELKDFSHLDLVLKYPSCFRGKKLTLDDLTVQALYVTLRKPVGC